jgi:hypothetical protein
MKIGDRVDTGTHGLGQIVNHELASDRPAGYEPRMVYTGRFGVLLDDAAKYPWYKNGIAYFMPKELTLKEPSMTTNPVRVGTHHYRSEAEARRNYNGDLDSALAEGRIAIGRPILKPGQRLLVDWSGRYFIEEPK